MFRIGDADFNFLTVGREDADEFHPPFAVDVLQRIAQRVTRAAVGVANRQQLVLAGIDLEFFDLEIEQSTSCDADVAGRAATRNVLAFEHSGLLARSERGCDGRESVLRPTYFDAKYEWIAGRQREGAGRFRFDGRLALPWLGLLDHGE